MELKMQTNLELLRRCTAWAQQINDRAWADKDDYDNDEEYDDANTADSFVARNAVDFEFITYADGDYKAARIMVSDAKMDIWINTQTRTIEGYYEADVATHAFDYDPQLDEVCADIYADAIS